MVRANALVDQGFADLAEVVWHLGGSGNVLVVCVYGMRVCR